MYKIQQLDPDWGWVNAARSGDTEESARDELASYRRNWPSTRYRLVYIRNDGRLEIIVAD